MKNITRQHMKKMPIPLLVSLIICSFALPASAHKVNIFAYMEGSSIHTESYFPDGKPVQNGKIEILNSEGVKVLEGTTDTEGKFSVPVAVEGDLTVLIHASMGHKSSFLLKRNPPGE